MTAMERIEFVEKTRDIKVDLNWPLVINNEPVIIVNTHTPEKASQFFSQALSNLSDGADNAFFDQSNAMLTELWQVLQTRVQYKPETVRYIEWVLSLTIDDVEALELLHYTE